jgi:hypothetical protein
VIEGSHQIEDALLNTLPIEILGEDDRRRGRVLGWLEDYGATGRQRRRDFASNLVQRPVHGVTHADDADRPAQRQFLAAECAQRCTKDYCRSSPPFGAR